MSHVLHVLPRYCTIAIAFRNLTVYRNGQGGLAVAWKRPETLLKLVLQSAQLVPGWPYAHNLFKNSRVPPGQRTIVVVVVGVVVALVVVRATLDPYPQPQPRNEITAVVVLYKQKKEALCNTASVPNKKASRV